VLKLNFTAENVMENDKKGGNYNYFLFKIIVT